MRQRQIEADADRHTVRNSGIAFVRKKIVACMAIALVTGLFLLVPSIRGFSLSAEQDADIPGPVQRNAQQLASHEVAKLLEATSPH